MLHAACFGWCVCAPSNTCVHAPMQSSYRMQACMDAMNMYACTHDCNHAGLLGFECAHIHTRIHAFAYYHGRCIRPCACPLIRIPARPLCVRTDCARICAHRGLRIALRCIAMRCVASVQAGARPHHVDTRMFIVDHVHTAHCASRAQVRV